MSLTQVRAFGAIVIVGTIISLAMTSVMAQFTSNPSCPTGFANFGDSLTDTGNSLYAFPFFTDAENPPYGESFFGQPAKRFCNGRLVPDFFSQAFNKPLLDAYLSVASFSYNSGVNFAAAGAAASSSAPAATNPFAVTPFQTAQFVRFQNSVAGAQGQLGCLNFNFDLPSTNVWSNWLYTITAGGNDLLPPFENGVSSTFINQTLVPQAVNAVLNAIVTLYTKGARQFLIFGLPAGGCSTVVLTFLRGQNLPTDSLGCIISVNSVVQNFNTQLLAGTKILRLYLTGANIAYFDYYSANIAILAQPTLYGFDPALKLSACCGAPGAGTLNYNPSITCGHPALGSNVCPNPDKYVIWDGIHFTEAFYRIIATWALNNFFTDGGINYAQLCNLNFANWGSAITFQQAYPFQTCNNLFA